MACSTSLLKSCDIDCLNEPIHLIPELPRFASVGGRDTPDEGLFGDDGARSIHLALTAEEARVLLLALYSSTEPETNELLQRIADLYHSLLHRDRVQNTAARI